MKKKLCLLILLATLFIPTFTTPIKTQQPEERSQDSKTLSKASPSSIPFIYGTYDDPYTLHPFDCWDPGSEKLIDQVAETLFTYNYSDSDLPLIPLLATGVSDISASGLNYTINLRKNVTFHDGTEFNAIAAKWNFDRMEYWWNFTGDNPCYKAYPTHLFYFEDKETPIWNHTEIVGEYAIKFVLNAPFVPFLDVLTYTATAMVSPTSHGWDITLWPGFAKLPVGTGPFVIDSFIYPEAKFHAYENYWREIANISKLIFSYYDYYDDYISLTTDLIAGSVHFIDQITLSMLDDLKSDPNITVLDEGKTDATPHYIIFNNNHLNQTWRQALSYAINYSDIIKELEGDTAARLKSLVPEGILYSDYGFNYPDFNITKAREIMQSMGFGIGWNTTYPGTDESLWRGASFATYSFYVTIFFGMVNNMERDLYYLCKDGFNLIGITLVSNMSGWCWYDPISIELDPDLFDMWRCIWTHDYNDPSNIINYLLSNSTNPIFGQVNNPYLQNLMDQGLLETDPIVREWIYDEIQRYVVEELMPYAWLFTDKLYHAHHVSLTGFNQNTLNRIYFYYCNWAFEAPRKPKPDIPGYSVILLIGFSVITILYIHRKFKKKLN